MKIPFLLKLAIEIIVFVVGLALVLAFARTWQIQHNAAQRVFLEGTVPLSLPDGFYNGKVSEEGSHWLGKKFNAADETGINVFYDGPDRQNERYSFAVRQAKGLLDKETDVLQLDYNIKGNPWWLRPVIDEIVLIGPGHYFGKLEVRIIPGFPFGLTYFELKK